MLKFKFLVKRLGIETAIMAVLIAFTAGLLLLSGSLSTQATEDKTRAESAMNQDMSQLTSVRNQLEQSGEAEKRFVQIQLARNNLDFSGGTEALKQWLRQAKTQYRFANNFKLNLPPQKPTDKSELSGVEYNIGVREGVMIELEAMSDLHVFSFVDDLSRNAPGLVKVTGVEIERKEEMTQGVLAQMMGGVAPNLVAAKVKITLIGITPKDRKPETAGQGTSNMGSVAP
jgi:hypothetical protein